MEILVFKTNIHEKKDIRRVGNIFRKDKDILAWNVDTDDVDKVLRIEAVSNIAGNVEVSLSKAGYYCEEMV